MLPSKIVVLVVEDEALVRMNAIGLLDEAGYEVLEARNADDALSILEARSDIGLVFTDVEMPGSMDGVGLAHLIRERWPLVQMLVASGKAVVDESRLPVGTRFFRKPYADASIIAALTKIFALPVLGPKGVPI